MRLKAPRITPLIDEPDRAMLRNSLGVQPEPHMALDSDVTDYEAAA